MAPQAMISISVKPHGVSPQSLSPDRCYALHVSGDHSLLKRDSFAGQSCREGASGVGIASGLHSLGDEVTLTVPIGRQRRIDLISFDRPAAGCGGEFALTATAKGVFRGTLNGSALSDAPKLSASLTMDVVPGPQVAELVAIDPTSTLADYTCTGGPQIQFAKRLSDGTLEVKGSDLDQVTTVRIEGANTIDLDVVSKTFDTLVARAQQNASLLLGGAYSLVVSSAFGQATTALTVELSAGSVRPEHLDLTLDWPFPTPRSLSYLSGDSDAGMTPITNTISNILDGDLTTYIDFQLQDSSVTCDGGNPGNSGYYLFSFGSAPTQYRGSIQVLSSSSDTMASSSIGAATSAANAQTGTLETSISTSTFAAPTWITLNINGSSVIRLKPGCHYNGSLPTVRIYELRVFAQPAN